MSNKSPDLVTLHTVLLLPNLLSSGNEILNLKDECIRFNSKDGKRDFVNGCDANTFMDYPHSVNGSFLYLGSALQWI